MHAAHHVPIFAMSKSGAYLPGAVAIPEDHCVRRKQIPVEGSSPIDRHYRIQYPEDGYGDVSLSRVILHEIWQVYRICPTMPVYMPPSFLNSARSSISSLERNDSCSLICSSFDIFIPLSSGRDRLVREPYPVIFFSPTDERRKEIYINNLIRLLGLIIICDNDVSRLFFAIRLMRPITSFFH